MRHAAGEVRAREPHTGTVGFDTGGKDDALDDHAVLAAELHERRDPRFPPHLAPRPSPFAKYCRYESTCISLQIQPKVAHNALKDVDPNERAEPVKYPLRDRRRGRRITRHMLARLCNFHGEVSRLRRRIARHTNE